MCIHKTEQITFVTKVYYN